MKSKQAFTLIELLVVVLIIGILAAVAVPQYKDAVDKARLANLVVLAKAANKASEVYYMANGSYPTDWTLLDLDFPGTLHPTDTKILNAKYSSTFYLYDGIILVKSPKLPGIELVLFGDHKGAWTGYHGCYATRDNPHAIKLCMHLSGRTDKGWVNNNNGEPSFVFKIN